MDAMILLSYVVWSAISIVILALGLKFLDVQEQRAAAQEEGRRIPDGLAATMPGFFGRQVVDASPREVFDDRLFGFIQNHIQAEHAVVDEFVHLPSIDSLYRQAGQSLVTH